MNSISQYKNKIICGDCIKIMNNMPEESVDVIITSPPYNIGVKYNSHKDNMKFDDYLNWMEDFSKSCFRVLKSDGSFFFNIGDKPSDELRSLKVAERINKSFKLQNTIHWVKSIAVPEHDVNIGHYKPVNSKRFLNNCHEFIFHFTKNGKINIDKLSIGVPCQDKSNIKRWNIREDNRDRGDMWFIPYETVHKSKMHPAMFPIKLPEMCIKLHGLSKDKKLLVLDPFAGSGSTAIASKKLGCDYVALDIDKKYCSTAEKILKENNLNAWIK